MDELLVIQSTICSIRNATVYNYRLRVTFFASNVSNFAKAKQRMTRKTFSRLN